ncbi:MAG: twin-arginine translocation signal domain-containing protein [Pirellulaceae bacterium]
MTHKPTNRRQFLKTSAGLTGALAATPYFHTTHDLFAAQNQAKNDRLSVAAIGNGGRGSAVGH